MHRTLLRTLAALALLAPLGLAQNELPPVEPYPCPPDVPVQVALILAPPPPGFLSDAYHAIPVPGTGKKIFVTYSTICAYPQRGRSCPSGVVEGGIVDNNVTMTLVPLAAGSGAQPKRALIFGTGYGVTCLFNAVNPGSCGPRRNCEPVDSDVERLHSILCNRMNRPPEETTLLFVAPHTHFDHINPQVVQGLLDIGYAVEAVQYHVDGQAAMLSDANMGQVDPWGTMGAGQGGPYSIEPLTGAHVLCDDTSGAGQVFTSSALPWSQTMPGGVQLELKRRGTHGVGSGAPQGVGNLDLIVNAGAQNCERIVVLGSRADVSCILTNTGSCTQATYSMDSNCELYRDYHGIVAPHGNALDFTVPCVKSCSSPSR